MFRQHFRRDLRSGRFVMEFAMSAPAALERVKAIPDPSLILILSDINMPGMSGLEMLPKVKADRPNVPVIMITAYGDEATRKRAADLGAAGLLTKPIEFGLLRAEIDQRLQQPSSPGQVVWRRLLKANGGCKLCTSTEFRGIGLSYSITRRRAPMILLNDIHRDNNRSRFPKVAGVWRRSPRPCPGQKWLTRQAALRARASAPSAKQTRQRRRSRRPRTCLPCRAGAAFAIERYSAYSLLVYQFAPLVSAGAWK